MYSIVCPTKVLKLNQIQNQHAFRCIQTRAVFKKRQQQNNDVHSMWKADVRPTLQLNLLCYDRYFTDLLCYDRHFTDLLCYDRHLTDLLCYDRHLTDLLCYD